MSFVLFAWIASIGYALVVITGKLTSKHSLNNPFLFTMLYNGSFLLWTTPIALLNHASIPTHWEYIVATGLCYALSTMCFVLALFQLDASTISPLFNFRIVFSVVLAALLIGEILPLWKYQLIAVIFVCGLFTTIDEKFSLREFFRKPVATALFGMIFTSLGSIATNRALTQESYWTVSVWVPIFIVFFLAFTFPKFVKDVKNISLKPILIMLLIGGFDTIATLAGNKAFGKNVSITSVIISLPISMFIAVFFSAFAPHLLEKHTVRVYAIRFAAAFLMIAAALKLSG